MRKNILLLAGKNTLTASKIAEIYYESDINIYIASVNELECPEEAPAHEMRISLPLVKKDCKELLCIINDAKLDMVIVDSVFLPNFIAEKISCPVINIRHSLNPYNEKDEDKIFQEAIDKKEKYHGCTVCIGDDKVLAKIAFNLEGASVQKEGADLVEAVTYLIETEILPIIINNMIYGEKVSLTPAVEKINIFLETMGYVSLRAIEKY